MDPLSQAAIGAAAAQSGSRASTLRHALWIGALAGMAPDLDVLIQSNTDPLLALEYHRQFTHSLFFVPVGALICACVFYPLVRQRLTFRSVWFFAALGYGTHGLLDACTTYGTQLLWPLTNARFAWHNVSVIDPLFTLPLLLFLMMSAVRRTPGGSVTVATHALLRGRTRRWNLFCALFVGRRKTNCPIVQQNLPILNTFTFSRILI